jgi:SAM-dependent methyltransferase
MREAEARNQKSESGGSVIWHDLECGSYSADLPLWRQLAEAAGGEVLDLGCGTGRVALYLARLGHRVAGIDTDPVLVAELNRRARSAGLPVAAEIGDARDFDLGRRFGLVLAPMQLLQLFDDARQRRRCLACASRHLDPGASLAVALLAPDGGAEGTEEGPPLPDVRESDGWVYSSLPVAAVTDGSRIFIRRLRQTVSPAGELCEEEDEVYLADLPAKTLETEAGAVGLNAAGRRLIPPTEDHVGSTVVLLRAG